MNKYITTKVLLLALCIANAQEKFDITKLASTPPMGWNSFDAYDSRINEEEFKANVDVMADELLEYGFNIATVDYLWFNPCSGCVKYPNKRFGHGNIRYAADGGPIDTVTMDEYGRLLPSPNRFPSAANGKGFKEIADYVHSKGLKFGIHIMRGIHRQAVYFNTPILGTEYTARDIAKTYDSCTWSNHMYGVDASKPGAQEYYNSLFKMYAEWGVDFVKADDMMVPPYHDGEIEMMWKAIQNSGRPMLLSLSCGEAPISKAKHVSQHSHMWRISIDFWDEWEDIKRNFILLDAWSAFIGPNSWPDADMIPFGHISLNGRPRGPERQSLLTWDEHYTLMSLWCMARSPLIIGSDLLSSSDTSMSFFKNKEILAINQNSYDNRQVYKNRKGHVCWIARIPDSEDVYIALFNTADKDDKVGFNFEKEGLRGTYAVRDLWSKQELGNFEQFISREVRAHGAVVLRLSKQ